jgi:hypothetical protein
LVAVNGIEPLSHPYEGFALAIMLYCLSKSTYKYTGKKENVNTKFSDNLIRPSNKELPRLPRFCFGGALKPRKP